MQGKIAASPASGDVGRQRIARQVVFSGALT
jgi:hypothetical protein